MTKMRKRDEIRRDIVVALAAKADTVLQACRFTRPRASLTYSRHTSESIQSIAMDFFPNPTYRPGVEAHIYPRTRVKMPAIGEKALELVEGDALLLANVPGLIVNEPCEFAAPTSERRQWYATGKEEIEQSISGVTSFVEKWVVPLLDELQSHAGLRRIYESSDDRIVIRQRHWYIAVAVAYLFANDNHAAWRVLVENLGDALARQQYATAFRQLSIQPGTGAVRGESREES